MSVTSPSNMSPQAGVSPKTALEAAKLLKEFDGAKSLSMSAPGRPTRTVDQKLVEAIKQALLEVSKQPETQELTSTAAAKRLGISRPTLLKFVKDGRIPAHKVGTHTRFLASDVDRFRAQMLKQKVADQRAAFEELQRLESELES